MAVAFAVEVSKGFLPRLHLLLEERMPLVLVVITFSGTQGFCVPGFVMGRAHIKTSVLFAVSFAVLDDAHIASIYRRLIAVFEWNHC